MKYKRFKSKNIIAILFIIITFYFYNNTDIFIKFIYYTFTAVIIIGLIYFCYRNYSINDYSIETIDSMNGTQFEKYLISVYKSKGYKVTHVGGPGDYGADLILNKDNEKIIVQAKRYSNSVGVKAVQEVISAREYYNGTKAIVVTNNFFTPNAKTMASKCNVILIDRNKLLKL